MDIASFERLTPPPTMALRDHRVRPFLLPGYCQERAMSFAVTDPTPTAPVRTDAAWLDAHWMPYTGNRQFKANPRMIVEGSGAYYTDSEGRKIFDGLSGLWCAGLGHGRREIAEAIGKQAMKLDYAPAFQFGHPLSFELANQRQGADARRAGLCVLHRLGLRVGRHVAEDGPRLLARQGPGHQDAPDRPRKGLPRRELWRHLGGRHRGQPQAVRPGRGGRPPAPHPAAGRLVPQGHGRHERAARWPTACWT